jgi:hypothetical protein
VSGREFLHGMVEDLGVWHCMFLDLMAVRSTLM